MHALVCKRYGCPVVKGSIRTRGTAVRLMAAAGSGYLLGMIPSADVAARIARRPDLRGAGTGKPGAMNAGHVLGKSWGSSELSADVSLLTTRVRGRRHR